MKLPNALRPAAIGKFAVTAVVVAAAAYAGWQLWDHYEVEPWTRDGRVKAYVVQVAPDVSGLVTSVPVHDNQDVKAGDLLFEIDRARFQLAYDQAQASVRSQQVAHDQALRDAKRNRSLGQLVAAEAVEQSQTKVQQTAFGMTSIKSRTVLAIYFDKNKKVIDKAVYTAADGKTVTVESRRTPSFGEDRTFIQQILQSFGG